MTSLVETVPRAEKEPGEMCGLDASHAVDWITVQLNAHKVGSQVQKANLALEGASGVGNRDTKPGNAGRQILKGRGKANRGRCTASRLAPGRTNRKNKPRTLTTAPLKNPSTPDRARIGSFT